MSLEGSDPDAGAREWGTKGSVQPTPRPQNMVNIMGPLKGLPTPSTHSVYPFSLPKEVSECSREERGTDSGLSLLDEKSVGEAVEKESFVCGCNCKCF